MSLSVEAKVHTDNANVYITKDSYTDGLIEIKFQMPIEVKNHFLQADDGYDYQSVRVDKAFVLEMAQALQIIGGIES